MSKIDLPPLPKGKWLPADQRADVAALVVAAYTEDKKAIRQIAAECGRSYGFVHGILADANVKFRS
ncbi:transcriptional regulator [Streptomyces sp. N2-109]|uniref:Transcriptional regulator n=1 Tax=Streptomyces gossypii TaxID=2883101 RepID=A0ABT2JUM1_9ACTN|nr:transcriptional regulator [Streptomyces gossypii]